MQVLVEEVYPNGAWATTWTGEGVDFDTGQRVTFVGDWRPMRDIGDAIAELGEAVLADVPDWALGWRS